MNTRSLLDEVRHEALDDLLSRWANWLHPIRVGRGHASTAAGCGLYKTSRQYDDENGALDDQIEHTTMSAVQACADRLDPLHRAAIHLEAENQRSGTDEWRSPVLPAVEAAARQVITSARARMLSLTIAAGLID